MEAIYPGLARCPFGRPIQTKHQKTQSNLTAACIPPLFYTHDDVMSQLISRTLSLAAQPHWWSQSPSTLYSYDLEFLSGIVKKIKETINAMQRQRETAEQSSELINVAESIDRRWGGEINWKTSCKRNGRG